MYIVLYHQLAYLRLEKEEIAYIIPKDSLLTKKDLVIQSILRIFAVQNRREKKFRE